DAEPDGDLDRLVELGLRERLKDPERLVERVALLAAERLQPGVESLAMPAHASPSALPARVATPGGPCERLFRGGPEGTGASAEGEIWGERSPRGPTPPSRASPGRSPAHVPHRLAPS